jgi:hypothetical protein
LSIPQLFVRKPVPTIMAGAQVPIVLELCNPQKRIVNVSFRAVDSSQYLKRPGLRLAQAIRVPGDGNHIRLTPRDEDLDAASRKAIVDDDDRSYVIERYSNKLALSLVVQQAESTVPSTMATANNPLLVWWANACGLASLLLVVH